MDSAATKPTEKQIRDLLVQEIAEATGLEAASIDIREPFASFGLSSIEAVHMVGVLESHLGIALDATLLWDHATIEALARHLARAVSEP